MAECESQLPSKDDTIRKELMKYVMCYVYCFVDYEGLIDRIKPDDEQTVINRIADIIIDDDGKVDREITNKIFATSDIEQIVMDRSELIEEIQKRLADDIDYQNNKDIAQSEINEIEEELVRARS